MGWAGPREFAREGASVVVSARPSSPTGLEGTAEETARAIVAEGGEAFALPCNVSDETQVRSMVERAVNRYGKIDVLVNNAGMMILGESIMEIDPARWDRLMATNVRGPYLVSRQIVPMMIERGGGNIINIGSRMGSASISDGGVLYSSSKAALHMFSLCLAEKLREHNIAVNVLSPGSLRSEGSSAIPWAQHDWHERVEPEVVGPSAVYLALQDAGSMTGQIVQRAEFGETWGTDR